MMEQATTRDLLDDLAKSRLGSPALQEEADRVARSQGGAQPSAELKETIKRTAKKWLPQGKRTVSRAEAQAAAAAFNSKQTDIEDAVERAGGKRGGSA
jgi:hypothetical protein